MVKDLDKIYKLYAKDIYYFVYSLSKDKHVAEDITSETIIKAIQSIDQFKGKSDIKVWLFQIAKHTYYSYLKKEKPFISTEVLSELKGKSDIENDFFKAEDSLKIHELFHKLPEPYKEVFNLRMFAELSFKEIGELYGKTDNWACVTFYRAKNKIREGMKKE